MMNTIMVEDYIQVLKDNQLEISRMEGKTVFITGATGLIGKNIVYFLDFVNQKIENPIQMVALVRNQSKAEKLFEKCEHIKFVIGDVANEFDVADDVDYIIHCASQTSSKGFVETPVETIGIAVEGTKNVLKFAHRKQVESVVYLSTMEVYGTPDNDDYITEEHESNLDTMNVRSCYPESKRLCESMCASYHSEYGVPVKVIRLTQTFGTGVAYDDGRVFAEFARCAIEKRNIVLHTKGDTKRSYLYTADAVSAIIKVLLNGVSGKAYNAANKETYCSILEMAQLVAEKCAENKISVEVIIEDSSKYGFAPTLHMNLDTTRLEELGWKPHYALFEMYNRMIQNMNQNK
ncbi:MAG: NAD(P)-dependent oxidoreductase [Eubacteriales bacterium]|nr:NAD(P)-dependent oxidoreductase [Eubacteriales bacterium]